MATIDVESAIEQAVRSDFASTGLQLSDFDFSGIKVSLVSYTYSQGPSNITPVSVRNESFKNCSTEPISRTLSVSVTDTTTLTATLNSQINFGRTTNAGIQLPMPPVVASGSVGTNTMLTLGGSVTATSTSSRTVNESLTFTIPGCSEVDVGATWSSLELAGGLSVIVEATGRVKFDMRFPGGFFTSSNEYPISQQFTVTGSYSGVTGAGFEFTPVQRAVICPPGSACALQLEEGSGVSPPSEEGVVTPPAEEEEGAVSPAAIYRCGDEFPLVTEGLGPNDPAAEQAAMAAAQVLAQTQCPTICPAVYVSTWIVRFYDAPGRQRKAKLATRWRCSQTGG